MGICKGDNRVIDGKGEPQSQSNQKSNPVKPNSELLGPYRAYDYMGGMHNQCSRHPQKALPGITQHATRLAAPKRSGGGNTPHPHFTCAPGLPP
jgi:predicted trehalose synthase